MNERMAWVLALLSAAALALWSVLGAIVPRTSAPDAKRAVSSDLVARSASPSRLQRRRAAEGTLLSGVVRDQQQNAVDGATVCAACAGCTSVGPWAAMCTRSASDGRYRIEAIAPAAYYVTATAVGFAATSAAGGRAIVIAADERRDDVDIELRLGGARLAGTVLDATGGPIAGAQVRALRVEAPPFVLETTTDDDGGFELALIEGYVQLTGHAEGYAPALVGMMAPAEGVEVVLTPGSRVSGMVVEAGSERPLADVAVRAVPEQARSPQLERSALTQADGTFTIHGLEPGRYALIAKGDRVHGAAPEPITIGLTERLTGVKIEVVGATEVHGRVVEVGSHTPCREGAVVLGNPSHLERSPPPPPGAEGLPPGPEQGAAIEADGSVHFSGVPPGLYYVTVRCRDRTYASGPRALLLSLQPVADLLWEVSDSGSIAIEVVDAAGRAVAGYPYAVERGPAWTNGSSVTMPGRTDEAGRGILRGLPAGGYTVGPLYPDQGTPVPVELSREHPRADVTLKLAGSGSILVEVRDGAGKPINALQVVAFRTDEPDQAATPRSEGALIAPQQLAKPKASAALAPQSQVFALALGNGRFLAGPLPAGNYTVRAEDGVNPPATSSGAADVEGGSQSVTVVDGEESRLSLIIARGGSIRGRVVDTAGQPLANVWVEANYDRAGGSPGAWSSSTVMPLANRGGRALTDPKGRFDIDGLQAHGARFSLLVSQPGGSSTRKPNVEVDTDIEITLPAVGSLSGMVVNPQGHPISAFTAQVRNLETGTTHEARFQGESGSFLFSGVAPGRIELQVFDERGAHAETSLDLAPGKEQRGVRLVLQLTRAAGG
jgi:protocatechuate 3,4-dioxygenase beta subunit